MQSATKYGSGKGIIWLEGVKCSGTEFSLDDCKTKNWVNSSCEHTRDLSVDCDQSYEQGVLLLYLDPIPTRTPTLSPATPHPSPEKKNAKKSKISTLFLGSVREPLNL